MSDFELFMAVNDNWSAVYGVFTIFLSVTFAFLVAGYFIAAELQPGMASVVVALYTMAATVTGLGVERHVTNAIGLAAEVRNAVLGGQSTLGWHSHANEAAFTVQGVHLVYVVLLIITYIGALIFFFHQRHVGRAQ